MRTLLAAFIVTTYCSLTFTASIRGEPEQIEEQELSPYMRIASKAPSQQAYLAWLRYMLRQNKVMEAEKRMSDYRTPYNMKYRLDKRNDGIWVWMPAQGYISIPHQQEEANDAPEKPGKIMRYGK